MTIMRGPLVLLLFALLAAALLVAVPLWKGKGIGINSYLPAPRPEPATVDEILAHWARAFDAIRTLRGSQQIVELHANRSSQPLTAGPRGTLRGTDEVYERQGNVLRYRVAAHFTKGDEVTLWDGTQAFRYRSWLHEVYRPLPESYGAGAYWVDDIDELSLLTLLAPIRENGQVVAAYDLVGTHDLDGRRVIELRVKPGMSTMPFGLEGTRVYLDAATFLPYRIVTPSTRVSARVEIERTVMHLAINTSVDNSDFTLPLPPGTVTVYEQAHWAPQIQVYSSLLEAAQQGGFPLYLPPGSQPQQVYAMYLVEIDGQRSPVVAVQLTQGVTLLAGRYLPQYGREALDERVMGPAQAIDVDGQPATIRVGSYGRSAVTVEKQGIQIEISGELDQEKVLRLAHTLQPAP